MSTHSHITLADQPLATWRGGTTRAIYADPPETLTNMAASRLWIGTATIERDGPYSVFPNRTRIHMPMRGNGLHLHFDDPAETLLLKRFDQAAFPGDRPLTVALVDGTVEAFNLIFTSGVTATVDSFTVKHGTELMLPAQANTVWVLYLVEGNCSLTQEAGVQEGSTVVDGKAVQLAESDAYLGNGGVPWRVGVGSGTSRLIIAVAKILVENGG